MCNLSTFNQILCKSIMYLCLKYLKFKIIKFLFVDKTIEK